MCPWAWQRSKSPWSLDLTVTDNQSLGRRGGLYPARVMCPWACQCSKSPWSLVSSWPTTRARGVGVESTPPEMCIWVWQRSKSPWSLASPWPTTRARGVGVMRFWAWQRSKSPWSLALIVTDNQSEGRRGGLYPARVMSLGLAMLEKPMELSSHPDRQPEWGASGWTLPSQGGVSLGLATLEKPLELSSHRDRQPEWGASGWTLPRQSDVSLGLATLKKPLELSSHRDRQPEWGASGWKYPVGVISFWACQRSKKRGA